MAPQALSQTRTRTKETQQPDPHGTTLRMNRLGERGITRTGSLGGQENAHQREHIWLFDGST